MVKEGISELWRVLKTELESKGRKESFYPGADELTIKKVEKHLNLRFPESVKEFYSTNNGEVNNSDSDSIFELGYLLPLLSEGECVVAEFDLLNESASEIDVEDYSFDPAVRPRLSFENRIPIITDFAGNYCFIDLDPSSNGSVGQVVYYDGDAMELTVHAANLAELLTKTIKRTSSLSSDEPQSFEIQIRSILKTDFSSKQLPELEKFSIKFMRISNEVLLDEEKSEPFPNQYFLDLYSDDRRSFGFTLFDENDEGQPHVSIQANTGLWLKEASIENVDGKKLSNANGLLYKELDGRIYPIWFLCSDQAIDEDACLVLQLTFRE